jgi:hypothetical protein
LAARHHLPALDLYIELRTDPRLGGFFAHQPAQVEIKRVDGNIRKGKALVNLLSKKRKPM